MQERKPCQYCGEKEKLELICPNITNWCVICGNCGARGPLEIHKEMAILRWNSRIQEAPEIPQERPLITTWMDAENAYCPLRNGACRNSLCMMWLRIGDNKGRCGLVNTIYINSTGCGAS